VEVSSIIVEMVGNGLRKSGATLIPIKWLVHIIRSHLEIIIFREVMVLGHRVPNIKPVGPSQLHHILFMDFVVDFIIVSMMREGTNVLIMAS